MSKKIKYTIGILFVVFLLNSCGHMEEKFIAVNEENFIRAETDTYFATLQKTAGGVNKFNFLKEPTKISDQSIVRLNRDTLYGSAIVDTEGGAFITIPKTDGRYMSIVIIDNDHYIPNIFNKSGTYQIKAKTRYVLLGVRVYINNPNDKQEVAYINKIFDGLKLETKSSINFASPNWNQRDLAKLRASYKKEFVKYNGTIQKNWSGKGPGANVDEKNRAIGVAAAWGFLPNEEAMYISYFGNLSENKCYKANFTVPENRAFWSITVYDNDGYLRYEKSILNSANVKFNKNGTFTAYFGSQKNCGNVANRLNIPSGWNYMMRIYKPGQSVLNGKYKLPELKEFKK